MQPAVPTVLLIGGPILVGLAIFANWYLQRQVASRTRHLDAEIRQLQITAERLRESEESYRRQITSRNIAEEALLQEQRLLVGIIETTDVLLVCLDRDFNFVRVNPAYAASCNLTPEEMVGKNHFVLFPNAENEAIFRQVRDTGETVFYKDKPFEYVDQPERGVTYWDWSLSALRDPAGSVHWLVLSLRETTSSRLAEIALQEQKEELQMILDSVPALIFYKDLSNRIVRANKRWFTGLGLTREKVLGQKVSDFLPEDVAAGFQRTDREVMTSRQPLKDIEEIFTVGNQSRFFLTSKYPHLNANGEIIGIIGFSQDITETRQTKDALLESYEIYQSLLETTLDGFWLLDTSGKLLDVNASYARLSGYSRQELLGMQVNDLESSESAAETAEHIRRILETGNEQFESVHRRKDGSTWNVEVSASYTSKAGGHVCGFFRDITERLQMEKALIQAKEDAEAADRTKSEFLANMSHEIRTPMNAILGMTDLALGYELPARARQYLEVVRISGHNLLTIINDILDLSKIDAGKLVLEKIDFSLQDVLDNLVRIFEGKLQEKNIGFSSSAAPEVPDRLVGDSLRLGQVLMNLVDNAIKFTDAGEVTLRVKCRVRSAESATLEFAVADTGIGLTAEKVGSIFEAFSQADGSNSRKYGGTGLGLSICKKLVAMMGGTLWVESVRGQGSIFSFTVQLAVQTGANTARTAVSYGRAVQGAKTPLIPNFKGHKVLLVEDNRFNQMLAVDLLKKSGLVVAVANNGQEAVVLAGPDFDALLMDIQMPEMDGFEATSLIRKKAGCAGLPIIAMTAHAMNGYRDKCLASGMDGYVTKPFEAAELFAVLGRFIATGDASADIENISPSSMTAGVENGAGIEAQAREHLRITYNCDPEAVEQLLHSARQSLSFQLTSGKEALAGGDMEVFRRAIHTIKGVLRNLGLNSLGNLAQDIEKMEEVSGEEPTASCAAQFRILDRELASLLQG